MPICPKCKQEYDRGCETCVDCHVPLVEHLEEDRHGAGEAPLPAVAFRAADEAVLDLMERAVAIHHLPYRCVENLPGHEGEGPFLVVPGEVAARVEAILEQGVPQLVSEGEEEDRLFRFYRPGEDREIRDPELLRRPVDELVAEGEAILDELVEIVTRGDLAARHRAAYVLSCMGQAGVMALIQLLKVAIEQEREAVALTLIRVVRDEIEDGTGWEEIAALLDGTGRTVKVLALQALTALAALDAFPRVLPLLEDPDPAVRDEADDMLCTLADEDMGFHAEAPEAERRAAIARWHAWWEGRRHG